ncbi:hypothetical protein ACLB2K_055145 [Fragaria x ananassa]
MNQAMLSKIGWRIFQHDNGLWANVFYAKYLQHGCLFGNDYKPPSNVSSTWRGVMHGAELIKKNLKWRVGNGNSIKFWYDFWLLPQALINFALSSAVIFEDAVISNFWNAEVWDVELLLSVLSREIVNLIVNVPTGFSESGDDTRIWCSTSNGQFSIIWDYALEWRKSKLKSNNNYMFSYTMHAWKKPPEIFFKLNVDGTRVSLTGKIGAGGVIRNHYGDWISGFQINLGVGEILDAEAWGLFQGLKLAVSLNINNLIIESDSAILVQLMNNSEFGNHPLGSLLQGCSSLMNKMEMESATLSHIFRECNSTTDALAKCSISHELGLVCVDSPPAHVVDAF